MYLLRAYEGVGRRKREGGREGGRATEIERGRGERRRDRENGYLRERERER
jgi:hypothetical protein